jgi:hypothetical protein
MYTKQVDKQGNTLPANMYEINIVVNRKTGSPEDNTVAEIQRFIADQAAQGKEFNINYVNLEFDPPFNNVGHARKVVTDMTFLRSLQRAHQNKALYIESEDADLMRVDPLTVINLIDKLDSNPHLDAARGTQDRFPEKLMENDLLFLQRRLWDFTEPFLRRQKYRPGNNPRETWNFTWHRTITGGWNTGYTAEACAMIGGYDSTQVSGEDMSIGEKMTMIRGDGDMPNLDVVGTVPTRSDSSPRRFLGEVVTKVPAYQDFSNEAINKLIRETSLEDLLSQVSSVARITPENLGTFDGLFRGHYGSIKSLTPNEDAAKELYDSIMMWAGFKKEDYSYSKDSVEIHNWDNLKNALESYRERVSNGIRSGRVTR